MMTVTIYKLDEYGYRKKSCEVYRAESIRISEEDCDIVYITLWNGSPLCPMRVDLNKYDMEVQLRTFP